MIEMEISENIRLLKQRVHECALSCGRHPDEIQIIAVSKTVDIDRIHAAVDAGMLELGENRVQEMKDKIPQFGNDVHWHMIGHLQTNKVKYIAQSVHMIHSLDSLSLAAEIDRQAEKYNRVIDVLAQVNISGEASKSGIDPQDTDKFIQSLMPFKHIRVKGIMTIGPLNKNRSEIQKKFSEMNKIFIDIKRKNYDNIYMDFLSMGMSDDYDLAIAEGSNILRIGTAIFGRRNYTT